jgi:hypothetical protein
MNRRLTEFQIRSTCRELGSLHPRISGRRLRKELKERFGAVGNTERVFEVWREEAQERERARRLSALPTEVAELQRRLEIAEASAAASSQRAELAEYRERAHQDHWAIELDRLRQEIETLRAQAGQGKSLPFRV